MEDEPRNSCGNVEVEPPVIAKAPTPFTLQNSRNLKLENVQVIVRLQLRP